MPKHLQHPNQSAPLETDPIRNAADALAFEPKQTLSDLSDDYVAAGTGDILTPGVVTLRQIQSNPDSLNSMRHGIALQREAIAQARNRTHDGDGQ